MLAVSERTNANFLAFLCNRASPVWVEESPLAYDQDQKALQTVAGRIVEIYMMR
jgi:hypothetical protein